jgi:hypothetical protein
MVVSIEDTVEVSVTGQHYALIITPLFDTQAHTCFGIHVLSSGKFLCPYELLEARKGNKKLPEYGTWMPKHVGACVSIKGVIISAYCWSIILHQTIHGTNIKLTVEVVCCFTVFSS